jgi:D-sedoheptulose 7-phosphate isomerase
MSSSKLLKERFDANSNLFNNFNNTQFKKFDELCSKIIKTFRNKKKLLIYGNGGSAADSIHFTGELVGKFKKKRDPLAAICLNTNIAVISSIGNDMNFNQIFLRQLKAIFQKGDLVIAFSTSGNSDNIYKSVKYLNEIKANHFIFTGLKGGKLSKISNNLIKVPSSKVDQIQEFHYMMMHTICDYVEQELF